ncbi:hypothetical transcript [Echinococcus multilocularis]|uniref:Hypothetical transcript n=1 Tax=Echinococcus multilocularis TaxID=6211 RepID=A0A068Y3Y9_ECHMU|nr:hypothetical transcript [Echinococcus multilocularis]
MTTKSGDVKLLEQCLQNFKSRAQEMHVGVNFSALNEERQRQEHLLRELQEIEAELTSPTLSKTNLPHLASLVGVELDQNTRCLHYLTEISKLERYVTDVVAHFAERSIELSDPQALHKDVFISKTLSDNVKSCWEYVDQLAMLAQIHIKTAAEYHQFFHEANEVEAKLEKHLRLAQRRQQATAGQESNIKDASKIANELREQLESMRSLWNRCIALVKRSESVVPMRLRLGGVSKSQVTLDVANGQSGPIMVRALISLTGPNYLIQQGELLPLIDNQRDTHLWRVETSSGVVEVPSICFWVTGNDAEATERAVVLKQQCKKVWLEIIRLSRQRLYHEYIDILSHLTSKKVTCTKKEPLEDLLTDIHNHLITQLDDKGRLQTVVENFQRSITISGQRNIEEGFVLRESELVRLRSPLMRLEDHLMAVGLMQEDMNRLNEYIENYLSEVTTEQNRIARMVEQLARITTESQAQLADLVSHLGKFAKAPSGGSKASRPKMDSAYRSRSQPFDLEFKKNLTGRGGGKRARSQTIQLLDAMVQIGTECKSAETQCRDVTSVTDPSPREPKNMAVQLRTRRSPVQRCVITQIGPNSKESCTQVDISDSSYSEECYVAEDMKGIVKRSSREVVSDRRRKTVSASALPRRPPVVQVNTCTQLGCMTHERSVSPIHALLQFCPNCQTSEFLEVQEYGHICSASQRCQPIAYGSLQSETRGNCICKRVQCGFPSLNGRSNLCCQVDVLGPLVDDANVQSQALRCYVDIGTTEEVFEVDQEAFCETRFVPSRCHLVCKRVQTGMSKMCNLANSFSQTIRTYARPICDHMASATQIGIMTKERECSPIPFENVARPVPPRRRYIQAQVRQPKVYDREPTVMVEASKIIDWDLTGAPLQTSHHENLYIEPIRKNLPELDCSSPFGYPLTPPYTNVIHCSPDLDRITRKAVFSVNSHIGVHPRNGRFETRQRRRKTMLRTASTPETVSPIEVRASPGLYHIASSPNAVTHPVDRCVARLQTRSLPNLLEGESQIEPQSTYVPPIKVKSTCSTCNDAAYRSRYAMLQTVSGPTAPRRTVRLQSNTLLNGIDREVQIGHAVNLGETQTSELVFSKRLPNEKVIGSCCANAQYVRRTHSQPNVVDSYLRTSRRSVGRSFVETYTSEIPVRQYSVQTCKRVPDVAIAEVSQHTAHMPDVGIAEVQIHPVIHWDNKKVQVHVDVSNPVRRVCVETPSIVRYDVSCDAMIKPARASKKAQVELFQEPIIPERLKEPNVYAEAPVPKITSNVAIQMSESMEAVTTQSAPQMHEKKLQCDPQLPCSIVSCQQSPQTSNKKLQVSVQIPTGMRLGGAEVSPVSKTTYGKKLQVDLSAALLTRQIQTISEPEPEPILMAPPTLQYSAPPTVFEDFSCDAPEPIEVLSKSTQSDSIHVPQTLGKRLQVSMNEPLESSVCQSLMLGVDSFTQFEPESLAVGVSQSVWEEPEPIILKPPTPTPFVMAAPPPSSIDDGCDPIHVATIESSSQAEKMDTWEKKLQVSPEPYSTSILNTRYDLPTMHSISTQVEPLQTVGKEVQIKPDSLALCKAQSIWIEQPPITLQPDLTPVYSAPPKETKDFSCDAPLPPQTLGKKLQVSPIPLICTVSQTAYIEPKPAPLESSVAQYAEVKNMSEGLQVAPQPLEIGCSQALWTEPPQITLKQEVTPVFSAPPKETKDFSCDALPPPQMMGKKLQVAPQPLAAHVSQTTYVEPKAAPLVVGHSQAIWIEPEPEPVVIKAPTPEPVVMSAPPRPTHEFGCDPLPVGTQGKKLQVSPEPLASSVTQSVYAEPPVTLYEYVNAQARELEKIGKKLQVGPEPLAVAAAQAIYLEPKLPLYELYAAQSRGLEKMGKKLQVGPEPLAIAIVQGPYEPSHLAVSRSQVVYTEPSAPVYASSVAQCKYGESVGKKLQVSPQTMATNASQTIYVEPKPTPLVVGVSQALWTEPSQITLKQEVTPVFSAPPKETKDFSCDALPPPQMMGKKLQVAPQPLAAHVSQTTYVEPKAAPLVVGHSQAIWIEPEPEPVVIKAPTPEPVVMSAPPPPTHEFGCDPLPVGTQGKKLQVSPEPLASSVTQSVYAEPPVTLYEYVNAQARELEKIGKKLQVGPEPLAVAAAQAIYLEPKLPLYELYAAQSRGLEKMGKKLQVGPEPLAIAIVQGPYEPSHLAVSRSQVVYTEPSAPVYASSVAQCKYGESVGKKLQVSPQTMATNASQTIYVEPKPTPLVVGVSQALWTEPSQITLKQEVTPVFSAPPKETKDFSCDALPPPQMMGKKLQVAPQPLAAHVSQTTYVEPKAAPLVVGHSQAIWIEPEPEPVVIKAPTPEPVVMSAPPRPTHEFGCDPLPVGTQGKKLQVAPEPLSTAIMQSAENPTHIAISKLEDVGTELLESVYDRTAVQVKEVQKFSIELQVAPQSLTTAVSQTLYAEPKAAPLVVGHSQAIWTEPEPEPVVIKAPTPEPVVMSAPPRPTHEFGCDPLPVGTQGKKLQVTPESLVFASVQTSFTEHTRSVYHTAFVQSKDVMKIGKMLQVAPEPLAKVFTQSVYEDPEKPVYNIATTQSGASKTLGKKLQVQPQPLATASLQAFWAEPEPVLIKSITTEPTVMSAPPAEGRDFSSSPIPQPSANASIQVSPTATFAHRAVDPLPSAECFTKMLQVTPELLGIASLQAIRSESPKLRVCPLSVAHSQTIRESEPSDRGEPLAIATAQSVGVKSFGKKLQVQPVGLSRVSTQTFWEEPAVIKAPTPESIVMAAPSSSAHLVSTLVQAEIQPIMPMVEKVNKKLMFRPKLMETTQVQATLSKSELTSMEIQSEMLLPYQPTEPSLQFRGKQAHGDSLKISTSQTEIVEQPLVIQTPLSPVPLYAAPAIKETFDFGTQYEPSMRSVRIQKGAGAFENAIHIGVQNSPSGPRRTPPSPRVHKIDWGIQCKPTVMAGITQTAIVEQIPHPVTPQTYTESTQTEYVESLPPTTKIGVIHRPIKKRKESEPLFSFVRETTAQVSKGSRTKSQGLIPYKTQVARQGQEYSLSVPSMLHLNVLEQGAATMSEQYSYQQQRSTSMNIPRRYASRIRSPSARGTTYAGRNRSMDTIFEDLRNKHMQDSLPRHSEGDLYSENAYVRELLRVQQMQLEERTEESLQQCVQAVGVERVYAMLRHIWEEAEEEKAIHEEMHGEFYTSRTFPGRRYTDVTTQYSIPFYDFHYGCGRKDAATQEGISHVQWIPIPPGHFVQIESDGSTDIDETYYWDPDLSSWHPKRNLFKWLARTPLDFGTQTDVTKAEENQYIDRLLRSRALSAYTSDFEMQQAGLKLNYPESGTVSVVSWRPRYLDGEDQLDVDTIGQLLRVSLVGARVPGTGEVISAADAFYRGILRMVYVDDSRGTIMPLPTAITANAVIVEKQYPRGVGIALHSTSRKYPVECQVLWNTSTLRRRTYRVNFIQKSTEERVNLSTALEEGLIDLTSGELVKIPMPSTSTLPDPLLESRESTLGAGETTPVIPHPERYSVHEAILNDILNVDLLAPEAVIFPSTEAIQESVAREGEAFFSSPGPDEESDMEV